MDVRKGPKRANRMKVQCLGYVGVETSKLREWITFGEQVLAAQMVHHVSPAGRNLLALRIDGKSHRLLLLEGPKEGDAFFGMEVDGAHALQTAHEELTLRHRRPVWGSPDELAERQVQGMLHFQDPTGYRIEIYHGLAEAQTPFSPPRPMGGFKTDDLGLGHAVLLAPRLDEAQAFYCDVLGFRVSDYVLQPSKRVFMHTNGRHHSLALSQRDGFGIAHLMVEVNEFDDLGRAYDIALKDYPQQIFSSLGRHSNDYMTSFYIHTPSGFPIEYGWGGRLVDDANWEIKNLFGPSLWGHQRAGLSASAREVTDEQRHYALERGIRAPLSSD